VVDQERETTQACLYNKLLYLSPGVSECGVSSIDPKTATGCVRAATWFQVPSASSQPEIADSFECNPDGARFCRQGQQMLACSIDLCVCVHTSCTWMAELGPNFRFGKCSTTGWLALVALILSPFATVGHLQFFTCAKKTSANSRNLDVGKWSRPLVFC